MALLAGCSSATSFTTELDATNGLVAGSPVTHGGTAIGTVTGMSSMLNGDQEVDLQVQNQFTGDIHHDSIVVLHNDPAPSSLDIYNPDPTSPSAEPGARLQGVSSQRELAALLASRGLAGFAAGLSGMMGALSPGAGTYGTSNGSPVLDQLQKDLAALQNQAVNSGPATAATAGQLKTLTQQAQQLQQQLIQQGNSPQAQKLRDQLNQLMQTLAAPPAPAAPPPASSGTLSVPPVHP